MKLGHAFISATAALITIGAAAWLIAERRDSVSAATHPPNVIVINIDTLRADHLSQYGYAGGTSTALDGFANHATRFADAIAPAPWTKPSVAALLTGLAPARHGATGRKKPLPLEAVTLAELLQAAGWRTAAFSDNPFVSRATQLDQGFQDFHYERKTQERTGARPHDVNSHETQLYQHAEQMLSRAARWIMQNRGERFLLYLQPMNVHGPYKVPPPARTALLGRPPLAGFEYYRGPMSDIMMKRKLDQRTAVGKPYLRSHRELYDTSIHYVVNVIASFFSFLKKQGLYDDALIVVTSDHGEELFDHGGFGHAWTLYEEVLSVPLFIKLPGQREGRVVQQAVSTLDVLPTILAAAGVAEPDGLDGRPLQPLMDGAHDASEREIYFSTGWKKRCIARGVREGPWKLIEVQRSYEIPEPRTMLFNLDDDPGEQRDVAAQHPEIVERLSGLLAERFAHYGVDRLSPEPQRPQQELDEDALRALGYVE